MLIQLKYILNSFSDEELKECELWIDSDVSVDSIIVEKLLDESCNINLITNNAEIRVNGLIDKEKKE